jgi:hypothetical protein
MGYSLVHGWAEIAHLLLGVKGATGEGGPPLLVAAEERPDPGWGALVPQFHDHYSLGAEPKEGLHSGEAFAEQSNHLSQHRTASEKRPSGPVE